jgi:hypothetical protein
MQDILTTVENDREQENDFTTVARFSELGAQAYDLSLRPLVQSLVTQQSADALRDSHPSRVSRKLFSDANPVLALLQPAVDWARTERQTAQPDNPFLALERLVADSVTQSLDLVRDLRDAAYENTFLAIYGSPWMRMLGQSGRSDASPPDADKLRELQDVKHALECIERGDHAAAVIRMLILLAGSRGSVRRDRLERSAQVLNSTQPFQSMGPERRAELIQQQSLIAEFEPQRALQTLPHLLKTEEERNKALAVVNHILGARSEMEPHSLDLMQRMEKLLGVASAVVVLPTAVPAKKPAAKKPARAAKAPVLRKVQP